MIINYTKIKNMKTKFNVVKNDCYVLNEKTGRLEWIKIKEIIIDGSGSITYEGIIDGMTVVLRNPVFYRDEESFKKGQKIHNYYSIHELFEYTYGFCPEVIQRCFDGEMEDVIHVWKFKNGEAKPKDIRYISFKYDGSKFVAIDDNTYYHSKEEVYNNNDIKVLREDGSEETIVCPKNKLALNDHQKAVVERLKSVLSDMKELNMYMFLDNECDFHVVNYNEVEKISCDQPQDGYVGIRDISTEIYTEGVIDFSSEDVYVKFKSDDKE